LKASIVVGLGWGDEGKGLTTDYLCSKLPNPIVVRFSGGQQAGHTVKIGELKHTFANFGSGTLQGYASYFSEHTTIYPVTMYREYNILLDKGVKPKVYIHPLAKITTPFDVFANRECEDTLEHGTCGQGVGKTMKRHLESPIQIYAIDLLNIETLVEKMVSVAIWYGYDENDVIKWLDEEGERFGKAVKEMPFIITDYNMLRDYENIIFEGSQGILLDMNHGVFPFVTFANTTSKNAQEICDILGIEERTVYEVTRAYHTRHGNGPFTENPIKLQNNEEENNKYNSYQLAFKTSKLDYNLLNHARRIENLYSKDCPKVLVVTCNDQIPEENAFDENKLEHLPHLLLKSFSPDSKHMQEHI